MDSGAISFETSFCISLGPLNSHPIFTLRAVVVWEDESVTLFQQGLNVWTREEVR